MGVQNFLIEGLSGSGKTTVAEELAQRGFQVVHGDRELAFTGDPRTGEPVVCPHWLGAEERLEWLHRRWIWPRNQVEFLVGDRTNAATFFCGGSRNHSDFIHLFEKTFVLEVDLATLNQRLKHRPIDEFGGNQIDRNLVARLFETREDLPKTAISVDASLPPNIVVDRILSVCAL